MIPENYKINQDEKYIEFNSLSDGTLMRIPYTEIIMPEYNPTFERLVGGEWIYNNNGSVSRIYIVSDRIDINAVREERSAAVKTECRERIFNIIDYLHQLDVALGIIPDLGYTDWIASMIAESNRCEDAYLSATTIAELKAVTPNFPKYVAPKE